MGLVLAAAIGVSDTYQWPYNTGGTIATLSYVRKSVSTQNFTQIATGLTHTVALVGGTVYTWGDNNTNNQLGRTGTANVPTAITSWLNSSGAAQTTPNIVAVAAGDNFCVALDDGALSSPVGKQRIYFWGVIPGQTTYTSPRQYASTSNNTVLKIAAGGTHAMFLEEKLSGHTDTDLWAFGGNTNGECGVAPSASVAPTKITTNWSSVETTLPFDTGKNPVVAMSCTSTSSALVRSNGRVNAWGDNSNGQLADGTTTNKSTTFTTAVDQTGTVTDATAISGGFDHFLIKRASGAISSVGKNDFGQLGRTSGLSTKYGATGLTGITTFSAGYRFNLASDGTTLYRWGFMVKGDTTSETQTTPVTTPGFSAINVVSAGNRQISSSSPWGAGFTTNGGGETCVQGTASPMLTNVTMLDTTSAGISTLIGGGSGKVRFTMDPAVTSNTTLTAASSSGNLVLSNTSPIVTTGNTTVDVNFTTAGVSSNTAVSVTGTQIAGWDQSASLTLTPITLSNFTIDTATTVGGSAARVGTVTLTTAAPVPGIVVNISSNNGAATVPATVTVAAGQTTGTFNITTSEVSSTQNATITTTLNGSTKTAGLAVTPISVSSVTFDNSSPLGGSVNPTGTVTINAPANTGGAVVNLSSNNGAASVPATVTVAAGQTTATFTVTTSGTSTDQAATITATRNGTANGNLTVVAIKVTNVTSSPAQIAGGKKVLVGTVTIDNPALAGGTVVNLSSDRTDALTVPATVTVAAGQTTANFDITTYPRNDDAVCTITANRGGGSASATFVLTVQPPKAIQLAIKPKSFIGGLGVVATGTVTINGPAPVGGSLVTLSADAPVILGSPTVTVPAGLTTVDFTFTCPSVATDSILNITADCRGAQTRPVTVFAPVLTDVSIKPSTFVGGIAKVATGTVTLSAPAPAGGMTVNLSSATPINLASATVTVPGGSTTADFTFTADAVTTDTTVNVTATLGATIDTPVTITAPTLASIKCNVATVVGGSTTVVKLTATLNAPAPVGGITINLSSDNGAGSVPATLFIPAGATSAKVTVTHTVVGANTVVTFTATYGAVTKTTTLTITP